MIRPLHDWLVVALDELPEKQGSIVLVHGGRVRTGTVLEVGPGKKDGADYLPPDVSVGDKIAFFRENLEHKQGRTLLTYLEEGKALLRAADVLFVILPGGPTELYG